MIPPLLEEIFSTRTVYDKDGNAYPLHSETPIDQIEFLISLLKQIGARRCLEIGLAYGISTIATCDAISGFGDRVMYSIDPDQIKWRDIGLKNIDDAGFSPFVRSSSVSGRRKFFLGCMTRQSSWISFISTPLRYSTSC